jgi:3-hydroxyacyl-[acyl-carrier-protein] dehydratase
MSEAGEMWVDRFQYVGRIVELDRAAAKIAAAARVPAEHSIFLGHFPGHALMPGVLLVEYMAQTSGFLLLSLNGFSRMPFLATVKTANFRSFVTPGTALVCRAAREHDGSGYAVTKAEVFREGEDQRVCDAMLTFRVTSYPSPELHDHMLGRAREVGLCLGEDGVVMAGDVKQ